MPGAEDRIQAGPERNLSELDTTFCPVLVCKTRDLFLSTPRFTADFITPHYVDPDSKDIPSQCRLD